jgi:hypothetical protein
MTWLIWRQHRSQALWATAMLGTVCGLMLWVGLHSARALRPFRGCFGPDRSVVHAPAGHSCRGFELFSQHYGYTIPVFELGVPLVLAVTGALLGAPLVAREIEQRTHLVAWTQSVTRRRWYGSKVLALGAGLTAIGLLAGLGNYRLSQPLTDGGVTSSRWPWFFSAGLAPAGEVLLAFTLAVAIGAWTRRTLPAVGAALAGFLVLLLATGNAVKAIGWYGGSQFWQLQLTFLALLLALATGLLALGWYSTRTRAV